MKYSAFFLSAFVLGCCITSDLRVETTSGTVIGGINGTYPNVRQWLGIPFAQPHVGPHRFLPPQPIRESSRTIISATAYPSACQQLPLGPGNLFHDYAPPTQDVGTYGEDCLYLSVWVPTKPSCEALPVVIWVHGGYFTSGGTDEPYNIPLPWIERTQSHIVVSIQYRLNFSGFPAAPGLDQQNLGSLDQRAAIEWSAGAASVDVHNFAYFDDPIVSDFIQHSGSVFLAVSTSATDTAYLNFNTVATAFNCSTSDAQAELDCVRSIPYSTLSQYLSGGNDTSWTFLPYLDDEVVFKNYTERYLAGKLSPKPAIFGFILNGGTVLVSNPATAAVVTLSFECAVPYTNHFRHSLDLPTDTYQYRGNFSSVSPAAFQGAYHCAELPQIFGTASIGGHNTVFENQVSEKMQDLWLAFIQNPEDPRGWLSTANNSTLALAGVNNSTGTPVLEQTFANAQLYSQCVSQYASYLQ